MDEIRIQRILILCIQIALLILAVSACSGSETTKLEENLPSETEDFFIDSTTFSPSPTSQPTEGPTQAPTITLSATPILGIGSSMTNPIDRAGMVYVPAGEFLMGSEDSDAESDEGPEHSVYLDAFWIYKYEVTNAQFATFVAKTGYETEAEKIGFGYVYNWGMLYSIDGAFWAEPQGPGSDIKSLGDHPAIHVTWQDANEYCLWAGERLPTEAEWEKAARGEDGRKYPWGNSDTSDLYANYCDKNCIYDWHDESQDDGFQNTAPVGSYPDGVSPYEVMDMAGNVQEFVFDWQGEKYYETPGANPTGPEDGRYHIIRGGAWNTSAHFLTTWDRFGAAPGYEDDTIGFRCAHSPDP